MPGFSVISLDDELEPAVGVIFLHQAYALQLYLGEKSLL